MFTVRSATASDLADLAEIELAAGKLFPADRIPDPDATLPPAILDESLAADLLIVAEADNKVVAFAAGLEINSWLHLEEVSVHPDFGRRGIGAALVNALIQTSRHRGMQGVSLTTFSDFNWNAPFYARLGFVAVEADVQPAHVASRLDHEASSGLVNRVGMIYRLGA